MIDGVTGSRIFLEVMKGVVVSDTDTTEEKEYRQDIKKQIDEIHAKGGTVQLPDEWL